MSARTAMYDSVDRQSELSSSPVSHPDGFDELRHHHSCMAVFPWILSRSLLTSPEDSGRYFSFPSFDMYEADQQEDHKETELKSP